MSKTIAIRLSDCVAKLPKKDQEAIKKRTAELLADEATLRQVREARERSQEEVAKKLHIKQAAVSKLERRTDMYLSTLRRYIEAMGGRLEIVACFPDKTVRITHSKTSIPKAGWEGNVMANVPSTFLVSLWKSGNRDSPSRK